MTGDTVKGNRLARIERATGSVFDLVVIGGGIHGAAVAKIASQVGLSVLLLEQGDYASGTSSRSSKMAHGGLRYLEMLDFEQVFEGIKAREALFEKLPNLVRPERFLIPVSRGDILLRCKLALGLTIYDLFVRSKERRHKWIRAKDAPGIPGHGRVSGFYQYTDGLMSDARLVFEFLKAGESFGCCTLNYAAVSNLTSKGVNQIEVSWSDRLKQVSYTSRAKLVINCAGPWAAGLHPKGAIRPLPKVRYSRGSHLVFSLPWRHPSLFLPLGEKGRYYFVWPHPSGAMVGTTEREVSELGLDPTPSEDEVHEILERLERDLPGSGLTKSNLHYAFAGVRTLPMRDSKRKGVSQLSRRHIWRFSDGVLTLLGGKYTTFAWTASEGVRLALKQLGVAYPKALEPLKCLPAALSKVRTEQLVQQLTAQHGAPIKAVRRAVERLGSAVERYIDEPKVWREVAPGILMLEVIEAIESEQAVTIEDVLRRRLELEATPSHGVELLELVAELLKPYCSDEELAAQRQGYLERMEVIKKLSH